MAWHTTARDRPAARSCWRGGSSRRRCSRSRCGSSRPRGSAASTAQPARQASSHGLNTAASPPPDHVSWGGGSCGESRCGPCMMESPMPGGEEGATPQRVKELHRAMARHNIGKFRSITLWVFTVLPNQIQRKACYHQSHLCPVSAPFVPRPIRIRGTNLMAALPLCPEFQGTNLIGCDVSQPITE